MHEVSEAALNMLKSLKTHEIDQYCILLAKLVMAINHHCDSVSNNRFEINETDDLHKVYICVNKLTPALSLCLYQILLNDNIEKIKALTYEIHKILRFNSTEIVKLLESNSSNTNDLREACINGFNK